MPSPRRHDRRAPREIALACVLGPVVAGAVKPGELPRRVKIAAWGRNVVRGPDGSEREVHVTATTSARLPELQRRRGLDTVPMDFEHASHNTPPPHKVAGHGSIEVIEGDGIYYVAASYTSTGREFAEHYPDVSGVFWTNAKGEVLFVSSVALCQAGAIEGAEFREAVLASAMEGALLGFGDDSAGTANAAEEAARIIALAREMLGYGEDAEVADIAEAMDAWLRQRRRENELRARAAKKSPPTNINQPDEQVMDSETKKLIEAQGEQITALAASVKQITDALGASARAADAARHNAEVEIVIAAALQAGKVVPATVKSKGDDGRYKLTAAEAKEILEVIPATVNTAQAATAREGAGNVIEAAEVFAIAASMGISEEEWKAGAKVLRPALAPLEVKVA